MALVAALIVKAMKAEQGLLRRSAAVVSEVIMVVGYFGYASLLLGKGMGRCGQHPRQSGAGRYGHGHRSGAAGGTQAQ